MLLALGVLLSVMGVVNMTGNISTIHSYNRRKVIEEDIPKYGKAMGFGTLLIGMALIVDFFLLLLDSKLNIAYITIPVLAVGFGVMLYAQFKYNKGIF